MRDMIFLTTALISKNKKEKGLIYTRPFKSFKKRWDAMEDR